MEISLRCIQQKYIDQAQILQNFVRLSSSHLEEAGIGALVVEVDGDFHDYQQERRRGKILRNAAALCGAARSTPAAALAGCPLPKRTHFLGAMGIIVPKNSEVAHDRSRNIFV